MILEISAKVIILIEILVWVQQLREMLSMKNCLLCVGEIVTEAETFGPVMQKMKCVVYGQNTFVSVT